MKIYCLILVVAASLSSQIVSKTGNHYLRPDNFSNVPDNVRAQLNKQHCLIPQDVETIGQHNLVGGEFARKGQKDWAAYCSVKGESKVIVIWGGPSTCKGEPFGYDSAIPDDTLNRNADPEQWGRMPPHGAFWKLSVIPRVQVLARQRLGLAEEVLASAAHDALQRTSIAGANGVYCKYGKWRRVWYAD